MPPTSAIPLPHSLRASVQEHVERTLSRGFKGQKTPEEEVSEYGDHSADKNRSIFDGRGWYSDGERGSLVVAGSGIRRT